MPGEQRTVTVTFPADYGNAELAGKEASFAVTIKEIREPLETPVDDELAKSMGLGTLDELRQNLRQNIEFSVQVPCARKT